VVMRHMLEGVLSLILINVLLHVFVWLTAE
jgi:hypothetical protein